MTRQSRSSQSRSSQSRPSQSRPSQSRSSHPRPSQSGPSDDGLDPLFEAARVVEPVSEMARARSLARARSRLAAGPSAMLPRAAPARASFGRRALAVAAGFGLMATGAAAAYLGRAPVTSTAPSTVPASVPHAPSRASALAPPPAVAPRPDAVVARSPIRAEPRRDARSGELAVLRRAQAAYASGDYPAVVDIVGQHARRFSNGRLAEEAEALRVRSLARSGRADEAQRALEAFARRFPQSVLLPALRRSPDGEH